MQAKKSSKDLLVPPKGPGLLLLDQNGANKTSRPPATFKTGYSSVFSQVKAFLPELARANTELDAKVQKEGREEVLVEREEEVEGEHIEMNLALVPLDCSDSELSSDGSTESEDSTTSSEKEDEEGDEDLCHHSPRKSINPVLLQHRKLLSAKRHHRTTLIQELI